MYYLTLTGSYLVMLLWLLWLAGWLAGSHTVWLTHWLTGSLAVSLADLLTGWLSSWLLGWLSSFLAGWLGRSFHVWGLVATEVSSCLTLYL